MVGTHRKHHAYTDIKGDPHSPVLDGFWHAHCGWYINQKNPTICLLYAISGPVRMLIDGFWRPRHNQENNYLAKDLQANVFCRSLSNPHVYGPILWLYLLLLLLISTYLFSWTFGILYLWVALIVIYNTGDAVNSIGHRDGANQHKQNQARDNWFLAFVSLGEGYHAKHHESPEQIDMSPWKIGLSKIMVFLLKIMGLAKRKS